MFEVELCLNNLSIRAASLQRFPDDQFFVLCHLSEERDDCSVKGFNKVESWTFQISFAELLLSCSSAEPLDEGTYIIHLPLKLVLRGNLIHCGCPPDLRHAFHLVLKCHQRNVRSSRFGFRICCIEESITASLVSVILPADE
ncbi:hypothetical protein Tco_0210011 [Tanacetum coccineum]